MNLKIGEAQQIYRAQVKAYQDQKVTVSKQLQDVRTRMEVSVSKEDKERVATGN